MLKADREAIHQIFSNLIENALKYAASGKRSRFSERSPRAEGGVEFYVRDFGPGISSEHLPRLFERFYRVDKARSRESGGTGSGPRHCKTHRSGARGNDSRRKRTESRLDVFVYAARIGRRFRVIFRKRPKIHSVVTYPSTPRIMLLLGLCVKLWHNDSRVQRRELGISSSRRFLNTAYEHSQRENTSA